MKGFMKSRVIGAASLIAIGALFTASCDVHKIAGPGGATSIAISPNPQTLVVNTTQQFTLSGADFEGKPTPVTAVWSVASGGGTITPDGVFTAGTAPNTFPNTIVATSGGMTTTATVIVIPGALATITVTPNTTMVIGGGQQFVAVGADAFGNVVAFTPGWSVVNGGGAVSTGGMFTAGMVTGTFTNTVQATSGLIMGNASVTETAGPLASITVTPNPVTLNVGNAQQFTAVGKDASGNIVAIAPTWSVVTAASGSITAAGLFTAGSTPATYANTVKAASGAFSGTATVNVVAGALASITVTPNPATIGVGATQQFTAVGKDAGGNVVAITPTWSVVAGGGTIGVATGLFTAGTVAGTYTNTIQASSGLILGNATVIETPGPLATIAVTPNPMSLSVGATQQYSAVGSDANGNAVAITPVWSVVTAASGAISAGGLFTAGSTPGTYPNTVKAQVGAIAGTATVTVTGGALASITVSPNPATMAINATQQFTAVGRDAGGNVIAITPTWAVTAGGGTIGISTGLFTAGTAPGTYSNTVRASVGTVAGTSSVIVTAGPLATITVSPNPVSVQVNTTQQFTAVGKDAGGNVLVITPVWSVVTVASGTINSGTGLFTASNTPGSYPNTIKAQSGTVSGTASVTVSAGAPVLTTIVVTPNPATVAANALQQFSASGQDQNGNPFAISPVWSVVNGGGSINATGQFTAGGTAGTFNNTVQAASGATSGTATVTVTSVTPFVPVVNLKTAALNGIMAGTAFTCVALGTINADIALSPGSTVTGFPPCVITGTQHLADATAAQNQLDLTAAYNTLAGLPCSATNTVGTTNLGGTTKAAGVYCSATSLGVTGTLTLDGGGNPNAEFVFQAGTSLITAGNIVLINGAQAKNVYWQVGSSATLGTASQFQGNILALTSISLIDNATLLGRALARNGAVSMTTGNTITLP